MKLTGYMNDYFTKSWHDVGFRAIMCVTKTGGKQL